MRTFEVSVNGTIICRAGTDPNGSLHAIVSWRGEPRRGCAFPIELSIGGIDGRTEAATRWPTTELTVGDQVLIRITEGGDADSPQQRTPFDAELLLRQQQEYVRKMAVEWGWEIRT